MLRLIHFSVLLLVFVSPVLSNKFKNCEHGNYFVENYIKYECIEKDTLKEVRPIGCSPTNDITGDMITHFQTHKENSFVYQCLVNDLEATYTAIDCLDPTGALLPRGKSRTFPDGDHYHCFEDNGKLKLDHKSSKGCTMDGKVYGKNDRFQISKDESIQTAEGEKIVGRGSAYFCRGFENGTFSIEMTGCWTSTNVFINYGDFGSVNDVYVQCDAQDRECVLKEVVKREILCVFDGKQYKNEQEWLSDDGKTQYACLNGNVITKGCYVHNNLIPIGTLKYIDDEAYSCYSNTQLISFGNLKGCPRSNGRITSFEATTKENDLSKICTYKFGQNGAIEYEWRVFACAYATHDITIDSIEEINGTVVTCQKNANNQFAIKILTEYEIQAWKEKTGQNSHVMTGIEAGGKGFKREVSTTTTTTITTTTPMPTTTTTTSTTTTPIPTTTTTTTTTPTPTTTTTTTHAPTTTTRPIPITTTTTTTTTETPTTITTTPIPITSPITTSTSNRCKDFHKDCRKLAGYCQSDEEILEELKNAVKKSSIHWDKRHKALEYLNLITTTNNYEEENNIIHEKPCSRGPKPDAPPCPCREQKSFNTQIVQSLCPKTCHSCTKPVVPLSDILIASTSQKCHKRECKRNFH